MTLDIRRFLEAKSQQRARERELKLESIDYEAERTWYATSELLLDMSSAGAAKYFTDRAGIISDNNGFSVQQLGKDVWTA